MLLILVHSRLTGVKAGRRADRLQAGASNSPKSSNGLRESFTFSSSFAQGPFSQALQLDIHTESVFLDHPPLEFAHIDAALIKYNMHILLEIISAKLCVSRASYVDLVFEQSSLVNRHWQKIQPQSVKNKAEPQVEER